jgi:hypothetical protein
MKFAVQRLREACGSIIEKLHGTVEFDETRIGGIERNKDERKKFNAGRGTAVSAMRERGGRPITERDSQPRFAWLGGWCRWQAAHLRGPDPLKKSDMLQVLNDITNVVMG